MRKPNTKRFYPKNTTLAGTLLLALLTVPKSDCQAPPAHIDIANAPIPIQVLVQSPAETVTDLQVICLFQSSPLNTLHGSLTEVNEKLKGLLDRVRRPDLFRGELGETLLIAPPKDSLGARRLLIIGLGDSQTFSPQRMQLVGEILFVQAARLGVAHPFFAPTVLDGGITRFPVGEVAKELIAGFLRAYATDKVLRDAHASAVRPIAALTFLAGAKNASGARDGIEKALAAIGK